MKQRTPRRALLAPIVALPLLACAEEGPERVNVVLVTLDTTRADRLKSYGHERIETPQLDRLAREGVRFERAYTAIPSTLPSHATILTGQYPARHGLHDNGIYELPESATTLAERFRDAGYRTGAFVSAFVLDGQFGLAQGFEHYDDEMSAPLLEADVERLKALPQLTEDQRRWMIQQASPYQRRADEVTPRAIAWLEEHEDEPFFLWVHYFDPHMDYTPPAPWDARYDPGYEGELDGRAKTYALTSQKYGWGPTRMPPNAEIRHMTALYDGEVSYMDEWIGRLVSALEERGEWENTLVAVVADHGEGFGEHGQLWEHNGQIFDETTRVPLILKLPAGGPAGKVVPELVRTIDLAPTVLDVAGLEQLPRAEGLSLVPLMRGDADAAKPDEALLETLREEQASPEDFSWLGMVAGDHKVLLLEDDQGNTLQSILFDLAADPRERVQVDTAEPERTAALRERLLEVYERSRAGGEGGSLRGMDAMTSEALKALGYTGGD